MVVSYQLDKNMMKKCFPVDISSICFFFMGNVVGGVPKSNSLYPLKRGFGHSMNRPIY